MRLRGEWLVLAERVIDDALTGNITLVSCLGQVAAVDFPAQHHGFAIAARFSCAGKPPAAPTPVSFRLIRRSATDEEQCVTNWTVQWQPGTRVGHVGTNYQVLRLRRPEIIEFRIEHRVAEGTWHAGPTCSIDVLRLELTTEEREALATERASLGLPPLANPSRPDERPSN